MRVVLGTGLEVADAQQLADLQHHCGQPVACHWAGRCCGRRGDRRGVSREKQRRSEGLCCQRRNRRNRRGRRGRGSRIGAARRGQQAGGRLLQQMAGGPLRAERIEAKAVAKVQQTKEAQAQGFAGGALEAAHTRGPGWCRYETNTGIGHS